MAHMAEKRTQVVFRRPFTLEGVGYELPAGPYWITRHVSHHVLGGHSRQQTMLVQIDVPNERYPELGPDRARITEEELQRALAEDVR